MKLDANNENWIPMEICGVQGYFNEFRIEKSTIPKEMYFYELRDVESNGVLCQYAERIIVDFYGTFISIDSLPDNNCGKIKPDEWGFTGGPVTFGDIKKSLDKLEWKEYMDITQPILLQKGYEKAYLEQNEDMMRYFSTELYEKHNLLAKKPQDIILRRRKSR